MDLYNCRPHLPKSDVPFLRCTSFTDAETMTLSSKAHVALLALAIFARCASAACKAPSPDQVSHCGPYRTQHTIANHDHRFLILQHRPPSVSVLASRIAQSFLSTRPPPPTDPTPTTATAVAAAISSSPPCASMQVSAAATTTTMRKSP